MLVKVERENVIKVLKELLERLGVRAGDVVEIVEEEGSIVIRPVFTLEAGAVVGEKVYQELINELEGIRGQWR